MRISVAVLDKKGDSAPTTALTALKAMKVGEGERFGLASSGIFMQGKDASRLQKKNRCSQVAIATLFSEQLLQDSIQFLKFPDAAIAFDGRIYSPKTRIPFTREMVEKSQQHEKTIAGLLKTTESDFTLVIAEPERILAARDPIGVRPLYYGENDAFASVGSNRKVLWEIGIKKTDSFPPGHIAVVSRAGFRFKPIKTLDYVETKPINMEIAAFSLQKLLKRSVCRRVHDLDEVAVAFSGGLDSSLVAFLAKNCGVNVQLLHVSLRNQPEIKQAKKAAEELKLPLGIFLFEKEDVANAAIKVVDIIEDSDPIKLAIGIPFYWTAQKASETGFKVLLAGQGADELFGGYKRYLNEYCLNGKDQTERAMFFDVTKIHESNLERDTKICDFQNVELRLPFASFKVAEFATRLPIDLKIEARADSLRKLILRKAAENMGLPASITMKPKKAIQYATGITSALKRLAKINKVSISQYISRIFVGE